MIFGLFKPKRQQGIVLFTEDRKAPKYRIPIDKGHVKDKKFQEAWFLLHALAMPINNSIERYLFVSERDSIPFDPLDLLSEEDRKNLTSPTPLARRGFYSNLGKVASEEVKSKLAGAIRFAVIVSAIMMCIMVIILLMGGGE